MIKQIHKNSYSQLFEEYKLTNLERSWFEEDTLDKWRHNRMLEPVNAFISKNSNWLTIGDGRFGLEAIYLKKRGVNVHSTDIDIELLKISKEMGFIDTYSQQNAEKLTFSENTFDYVLIKEAVHHFQKPWIALYEAFRVSKKGVILLEPRDKNLNNQGFRKKLYNSILIGLKKIMKRNPNIDDYTFEEEARNFIFSISNRELEKFLLAMNYRHLAHTGLNDYYFSGVEYIKYNSKNLKDFLRKQKLKTFIRIFDLLTHAGFTEFNLAQSILFKQPPSNAVIRRMKNYKWNYKLLPINPYI